MGTRILLTRLTLSAAILVCTISSGRLTAAEGPSPTPSSPSAVRTGEVVPQRPADGQVDERAKQVLDASAKLVTAIHSIEFRAESEGTLVAPGGAKEPVKHSYLFRLDGNRFRDDEFDAKGRASESYSFDGTKYQGFVEQLLGYRESKQWMGNRPQTSFEDPITKAYSWAFPPNSRRCWETLQSRESWNDVARRTRFIGETKSQGRTIVTLEVERRGENGQYYIISVDFDKDHGCVPIGTTSYYLANRKLSGTHVVMHFDDVDAGDAGRMRIPIEVSEKWEDNETTSRIDEKTLRINQPIDAYVFTIPRDRAKIIWGLILEDDTADFFKPRGPLQERLTAAQDDARRNRQRVLLILGDADSRASLKLTDLRETDWRRLLYDYQQVAIGKGDSAAVGLFKKAYPDLVDLQWPAFVVLDEAGKVLGSIELSLDGADTKAGSAKAVEFLHKHAEEKLDAEKLLADALSQARRECKNVFLEETGIYCKPCKLLSLYWERNQAALDANYVFLKIDPSRYANGPEVMKRFRPQFGGIPWVAILNADGEVQATYLGFPSGPPGVEEFMQLLKKTAPELSANELKKLREDLVHK